MATLIGDPPVLVGGEDVEGVARLDQGRGHRQLAGAEPGDQGGARPRRGLEVADGPADPALVRGDRQ
jgi:hypothetical protein